MGEALIERCGLRRGATPHGAGWEYFCMRVCGCRLSRGPRPSVTGWSAVTNEDGQDGRSELARRLLRSGTEPPGRRSAAQLQAT